MSFDCLNPPAGEKEVTTHELLIEGGAVYEKKEDRHGNTRSGYWMDGVFLGKTAADARRYLCGAG